MATKPVYREMASGPVATVPDRGDVAVLGPGRSNAWADGHTNFFTVWAWRAARRSTPAASLSVGEPVIVQGRLKVRDGGARAGSSWTSADIDAVAIGHDLARGTSAFRRSAQDRWTPP